jgi:hypothetical protein
MVSVRHATPRQIDFNIAGTFQKIIRRPTTAHANHARHHGLAVLHISIPIYVRDRQERLNSWKIARDPKACGGNDG